MAQKLKVNRMKPKVIYLCCVIIIIIIIIKCMEQLKKKHILQALPKKSELPYQDDANMIKFR